MSRRRKILLGATFVLGALVGISVLHHYQLKGAVARYKAELKARGEPMELAQVLPPTIPAAQNSAALFTNAHALLGTNITVLWTNLPPTMRSVGLGKALVVWAQPFVCEMGSRGATNSWEDIEAALVVDKKGLDLLCQLPAQPAFDFQLNYQDGWDLLLPQLSMAKTAAQRLSARTMASLHRGDAGAALTNILATQSIVQGMAHDRLLISELVRMAIAAISAANTWQFLQSTNLTEGQLATLQKSWADSEFIPSFENSLHMERIAGQADSAKLRKTLLRSYFDPLEEYNFYNGKVNSWDWLKIRVASRLWSYWWSYPDEMREWQGIQAMLEATRQIQTNQAFLPADANLKKQIEALSNSTNRDDSIFWFKNPTKTDFHYIISGAIPRIERNIARVAKAEVSRQVVVTAIALKRYQLKHGQYPEQLAALTPEFLVSAPLDLMDGQPLRYRRNSENSFTLYSIGENGRDDGGNPARAAGGNSQSVDWQNSGALDWVWPQPATAAEVQKYFADQASKGR